MQLLKFLFGIILVQIVTVSLILLSGDDFTTIGVLRLAIPLLFIALIISFWFSSITKEYSNCEINKIKDDFATEREKLKVNAERAKRRIEKEAQKNIKKEATSTHAKANFKVGLAFAGVLGVGALFVFTQMITASLLALSATGGALGGYYWRGKREENKNSLKEISDKSEYKVIDSSKKIPRLKG
ncbi:MAG: hypothetical protein GXO60_04655 [Epsilonproteobacteria bacterium]|nr:hypothetical protein [Campylobacterota bacterium]